MFSSPAGAMAGELTGRLFDRLQFRPIGWPLQTTGCVQIKPYNRLLAKKTNQLVFHQHVVLTTGCCSFRAMRKPGNFQLIIILFFSLFGGIFPWTLPGYQGARKEDPGKHSTTGPEAPHQGWPCYAELCFYTGRQSDTV